MIEMQLRFPLRYVPPTNIRMIEVALLSIALVIHACSQDPTAKLKVGAMEPEEYSVVASVVRARHLSKDPHWFLLSNQTTTFECNPPANTGLNINGSSGMRTQDQSPRDVFTELAGKLKNLTPELFLDLTTKSESSTTVDKTLPLEVKQIIWGPGSSSSLPKELGSPDFAIYHSRVGFNKDKTLALVYVAAINWKDSSKSFGEYVILKRNNTGWVILEKYKKWSLM